ncbi:hypothetical protein CEXT_280591 [Caerostris extrusa]|uniref:Uncharacterized protein n=1 Tax=Caerostris extrusa TaxID=172846 RepID=A0AAV4PTS3_CAEEX|nr:hypothetical protein CEXT_280591 [Caerostris extrusa]
MHSKEEYKTKSSLKTQNSKFSIERSSFYLYLLTIPILSAPSLFPGSQQFEIPQFNPKNPFPTHPFVVLLQKSTSVTAHSIHKFQAPLAIDAGSISRTPTQPLPLCCVRWSFVPHSLFESSVKNPRFFISLSHLNARVMSK